MKLRLLLLLLFSGILQYMPAQEFNPLKPDYELLSRLILEKINAKREKKKAPSLTIHASLNEVANFYTNKYVLRKFENNSDNKVFVNKKIKKLCKENGFNPRLVSFSINTLMAIKYNKRAYYYDQEEDESELRLYYGDRKPNKKEKLQDSYKPDPLKQFSYEEIAALIAEKICKDSGRINALNAGYTLAGIGCAIEPKSIGGRKIPQIKVIMILGGKIITW